jgi:hypothetical protein
LTTIKLANDGRTIAHSGVSAHSKPVYLLHARIFNKDTLAVL